MVDGGTGLTPGKEDEKLAWAKEATRPRGGEAGQDFLLVKSRNVLALAVAQPVCEGGWGTHCVELLRDGGKRYLT